MSLDKTPNRILPDLEKWAMGIEKNDTYKRVKLLDTELYNSFEVKATDLIKNVAKRITTIDNSNFFTLVNKSNATIYIGESDVTDSSGFPLYPNESLEFKNMKSQDGNEIYAITNDNEAKIYCIGTYDS